MFAKRFLHRFLMVFGRPPNLHFLILAERKHNFDIFGKALVGIDFDPQNLPKIVQKMVPRGFQEALERFLKNQFKKHPRELKQLNIPLPRASLTAPLARAFSNN